MRNIKLIQNLSKITQYILMTLFEELLTGEQYVELAYYLAEEWSSEGVYYVGQFVRRQAGIYKRKTEMTTAEAWNPDNYTLIGYYVNGEFTPV